MFLHESKNFNIQQLTIPSAMRIYARGDQSMEQPQRIRILVAKPGLDGHDRGAKVIVHALKNAGFEVIYTGLHQTTNQIIQAALQEDVNVIGLSILSGAHLPLTKSLIEELKNNQMEDVMVLVGGSIPKKDYQALLDMGVAKIFPTSSKFDDIVEYIKTEVGGKNV
jgi:methylmalonyl-CoA mutase C-terminal domain/subunit